MITLSRAGKISRGNCLENKLTGLQIQAVVIAQGSITAKVRRCRFLFSARPRCRADAPSRVTPARPFQTQQYSNKSYALRRNGPDCERNTSNQSRPDSMQ